MRLSPSVLFALLTVSSACNAQEEEKPAQKKDRSPSAFRFIYDDVRHSIDLEEIQRGTPRAQPKDAIPTIRKPESIPAAKATWLVPEERVLGVVIGGEARAYPLRILEGHELVNDVLGGVPIAPTY